MSSKIFIGENISKMNKNKKDKKSDLKKTIIIGAGEAGFEVLDIIKSVNNNKEKYFFLGFFDEFTNGLIKDPDGIQYYNLKLDKQLLGV